MNTFKARFTERIERTPTVVSFRFLSDEKLDFVPGQHVKFLFNKENQNIVIDDEVIVGFDKAKIESLLGGV